MSMRKHLGQEPTGTMYDEQEPRLGWIYTGDRTKSEDFLLGKKYDADSQSHTIPEDTTATSTIDLANKIHEDPLFSHHHHLHEEESIIPGLDLVRLSIAFVIPHHRNPPRPTKRPEKSSKEDRDRCIREVLADGAIRSEQRQKNIRACKERDEQEEKLNDLMKQRVKKKNDLSSSEDEEQDFIRPMMKQIVDDPSLKRSNLKHHHYHKQQ